MSSSSKVDPLLEALEQFSQRFHLKMPMELAHCSQFFNEKEILRIAEEMKTKVWSELLQKLGHLAKTDQVSIDEQVSIVNQFAPRIQSLIDEVVKKHGNYKKEAEALMMGRIHQFCDYFSTSIQEKLLLEKDMDIHTLDEYLEQGKSMTMNHFGLWRHGNLDFYDDHEKILKEELEKLANERLKNQWKHLGRCLQIQTPERQHDGNKVVGINDYYSSSDVAPAPSPTSASNIQAVAVATETMSNILAGNEGTHNEIEIVKDQFSNLKAVSVEQDHNLGSVTCQSVQLELDNNCDIASSSQSNQFRPLPVTGAKQVADGDGTFTVGESHKEVSISHDDNTSPTAVVLNVFDKANSKPQLFDGKRYENIDADLNTGILSSIEEMVAAHVIALHVDSGDVFGTEGQIACASENAGSSSEVVAQSEGFSDEENVTVISSETWTSESAFLVEDQNAICFMGIEDENEKLVGEHSIPTGESELNPNGDSIVVTNSGRKNGKKRRRSQKENNGPASIEAKRRRKFKETTISATASGQTPTLTVRRTKKVVVAVAAANSSAKVRHSKRNSKLASSPNDNTATRKKQGGSVKVDAKIVQVEGGFQCPEPACGKIFPRIRTYRQHHQEIHQLKNVKFRCSYPKCEKVFSRKRVLGSHQLFHIQPELFTCESCHRAYLIRQELFDRLIDCVENERKCVCNCCEMMR